MPRYEVVKCSNGRLRGFTTEDEAERVKHKEFVDRMEPGEIVSLTYDVERNPGHHRKLMVLVTYIAENSDTYDNKDKALTAVKLAAGHCDWVVSPQTGALVPVPKTINWKDMKQHAFDEFYKNAIQGVLDHILPYMNKVDLETALAEVAKF